MTKPMTRKQLELAIAGGTATLDDFEGFAPEEVLEVKQALPYQQRHLPQTSLKVIDEAKRTADLIFNVQVVDRMGDLIISNPKDAETHGGEGWILEYFELAGGPYLYLHDAAFCVGVTESTRIQRVKLPDREGAKSAWALVGRVRFFDVDYMQFAQAAWLLTKEGVTGSSVGFRPRKIVWIEDEKDRQRLGLPPWGAVLPTNELLEVSKAPVPANQVSVGLAAGGGPGQQERAVEAALQRFVDQGTLSKALRDDYVRSVPLGPTDHALRVASRVRAFMHLHLDDGEEPVRLECVDDQCRLSRGGVLPDDVPLAGAGNDGGREAHVPLAERRVKVDAPCCEPCAAKDAAVAAVDEIRAVLEIDTEACVVDAVRAAKAAADGQADAVLSRSLARVERAQDAAGSTLELLDSMAEDLERAVEVAEGGEENPGRALEAAARGGSDGDVRSGTDRRDQRSDGAAAPAQRDDARGCPPGSTPVKAGETRRRAQQPRASATGGDEGGNQTADPAGVAAEIDQIFEHSARSLAERVGKPAG